MSASVISGSLLSQAAVLTMQDFQHDGTIVSPTVNKGITFVLFYLPYCRFCQDVAAALNTFNQQNRSSMLLAGVDVTSSGNRGVMTHLAAAPFALNAFPTIILYYNGFPCSVYQRVPMGGDEVASLNTALQATQRGCGSCTLSACSVDRSTRSR